MRRGCASYGMSRVGSQSRRMWRFWRERSLRNGGSSRTGRRGLLRRECAGPKKGAPEGRIEIAQLYHAGVYDDIRRLVRQVSSGLKSAEMEWRLRGQ